MRNVEDFDPSLRNEAFQSHQLILSFLENIQGNESKIKNVATDYHTINLEKNVPSDNHKNLFLIFQNGSGGAKFSYREDKKFTITIYVEKVFDWNKNFACNIANWFKIKHSSFIHEFVHYLDIKEIKNLDSIKGVNLNDLINYYNHSIEIRGHLQQAFYELEYDLKYKYFKKDLLVSKFGNTKESFISKVKKLYFPHEFWKFLTKDNKVKIENAIANKYMEISNILS